MAPCVSVIRCHLHSCVVVYTVRCSRVVRPLQWRGMCIVGVDGGLEGWLVVKL